MAIINDLSARYANDGAADAAFVAAGWAKSEGVMYYDTTLNQFKRWDAVLSAWVFDAGTISGGNAFPGIETMQALFVDQGTNVAVDGSATSPFHSIASAYAAAKLLGPTVTNQIAIIIMGGTYDEVLTMDTAYIHLVGQGEEATLWTNTLVAGPTLYLNTTGAASKGMYRIENMTIQNAVAAQYVAHIRSNLIYQYPIVSFSNVKFNCKGGNGEQCIYTSGAYSSLLLLEHCKFVAMDYAVGQYMVRLANTSANNDTMFKDCILGGWGYGYVDLMGGGRTRFDHCLFEHFWEYDGILQGAMVKISTTANQIVECIACKFYKGYSYSVYADVACTIDIVGCLFEPQSTASYAISLGNAGVVLRVVGSIFSGAATTLDIYSSVNLTTPAEIVGNRMRKGMYQTVRTKNPIKNVGGDHDFYSDLPNAMASINAHGCIVKLYTDVTITAAITPGDFRQEIDGQGLYSLTRSGGGGNAMFTLNSAQHLRVRGLRLIEGDIDVTGNTVVFEGVDCFFDQAMINITGGSEDTLVQLDHCDSIGDADVAKYCIQTTDADPLVRVDDCYLQGGLDFPAINDTATNQNYKIVNSDILGYPGDPGTAPMVSTGAPAYVSHHVAYTSAVSGFANSVATPYDVFSANIGMRRYPLV